MFSKTYLRQAAGSNNDSERLRRRVARAAWDLTNGADDVCETFVRIVEQETGADVPIGPGGYDVGRFFRETEEIRDMLDAITCMSAAFQQERRQGQSQTWVTFCKRAFAEEGMAYRIDDDGEAHYVVDVAFHEIADAVIAVLAGGGYAGASASANKAVGEITKAEPDGKHAIRDIFDCVETAFKIRIAANKDLTQANIASELTPIVNRRFAGADPIAQGAATQTLDSLKDWTNACHKYRHGQQEAGEPPLELTIVLVGNGLNFARWIASLGD